MTRRKRNPDLNVAVCTESDGDLAELGGPATISAQASIRSSVGRSEGATSDGPVPRVPITWFTFCSATFNTPAQSASQPERTEQRQNEHRTGEGGKSHVRQC